MIDIVVDGGYRPDTIHARSGTPIRLVFHRREVDSCSERVVFSLPRSDRFLSASHATVIDLPGQAAGELRFTCGMGRYRGRIHIMDARATWLPSVVQRVRALETPLGVAFLLWLCSLPLIALVAIVGPGAAVVLPTAAMALVAWVVGCLWAFGRASDTGRR